MYANPCWALRTCLRRSLGEARCSGLGTFSGELIQMHRLFSGFSRDLFWCVVCLVCGRTLGGRIETDVEHGGGSEDEARARCTVPRGTVRGDIGRFVSGDRFFWATTSVSACMSVKSEAGRPLQGGEVPMQDGGLPSLAWVGARESSMWVRSQGRRSGGDAVVPVNCFRRPLCDPEPYRRAPLQGGP